jgi:hypothetical protein
VGTWLRDGRKTRSETVAHAGSRHLRWQKSIR